MKKTILALALAAGLTSFVGNAKAADSRVGPDLPHGSTDPIPEPSTYALFGIGAIGMLILLRRKKTA